MKKFHGKVLKMLQATAPRLIFALICGAAYFMIVIRFIMAYTAHVGLMALFIAPAVICGGAYLVIRLLRHAFEIEENAESTALMVFYLNLWIVIIAALFAVAWAMGIQIL